MKPSYSTRWSLCWIFFILALLTFVAGVFALPNNWSHGLGLTLVGLGFAGPSGWWLHNASRNARVPRMKVVSCLGILLMIGGAFLIPWKAIGEGGADVADENHRKGPGLSVEEPSASSSADSPTAAPSAQTEEAKSPTPKPTISEADPEATVTVTEVETQVPPQKTVTEVETQVPPPVTVHSEVPVAPAPPQEDNPNTREDGAQPGPSDELTGEPTTQTEGEHPMPMESDDLHLQDQTADEPQAPSVRDADRNRNVAGHPGQNFPTLDGEGLMEALRPFG